MFSVKLIETIKNKIEKNCLTSKQNFSQRFSNSGTVPASISELMLTLSCAHLDAFSDFFQ